MKTSMSRKGNCYDNAPMETSGKNIIRWLLKKEQMAVSAIASTPQESAVRSD